MKHSVPSVRVWVAGTAVAMAVVLLVSYRSAQQSEISTAAVDHTKKTLSGLLALEGNVADVIFARGDEAVARAAEAATKQIDELSVLTRDNPLQQPRLNRLRTEIDAIVGSRRLAFDAGAAPRPEAVVPQSLSQALRELRVEEVQLLTDRVEANGETSRQLTNTLTAVAVSSGLLLAWVFGLVVRDERKRRHVQDVLRRANEELDARVSARTAELHDTLDHEQALRHEAETSNRLKDEFLMTVSHELRTPLNSLLGWADMLRLGIVSDGRRQRAVDAIYQNAKLQAQLIGDLLDTARILTGKLRIEPDFVDLGQIVQEAANVVAPAAAAKGLDLNVEVERHRCVFFGDPGRLQQIVWNLISNAVKFTERGSVSVRLTRNEADNQMTIVVADTGMGIPRDFLPHVFDRFSQQKTGTTRPHGGLGLGLAIVRQLVESHGGTVRVQSNGEGHGAAFTVTLPALQARKDTMRIEQINGESATLAESRAMPALAGIRVLVLDDDPSAREMVTDVLEHCGAKVLPAESAAEARSVLGRTVCDVLLVDIAMPVEDGYSFIRSLRMNGFRQPAAALTAHAHDTDRERALESGFDIHIRKPVEPLAVALAVAALARRAHFEVA